MAGDPGQGVMFPRVDINDRLDSQILGLQLYHISIGGFSAALSESMSLTVSGFRGRSAGHLIAEEYPRIFRFDEVVWIVSGSLGLFRTTATARCRS